MPRTRLQVRHQDTIPPTNRRRRNARRRNLLYTARFNEDGTGDWLALDLGDPYFRVAAAAKHATIKSQVDVQANTRFAADVVGATAARRFELISVYPRSCKVFLSMTDNVDTGTADPAVPIQRSQNGCSHVVVHWCEQGNRSFATKFQWNAFNVIIAEDGGSRRLDPGNRSSRPSRRTRPAERMANVHLWMQLRLNLERI